jgi:hypothetical protein
MQLWEHMWHTTLQFSDVYIDPLYVHIDDKELRDYEVDLIQERAGIEKHQIDWSVDRVETGSQYGLHDAEITDDVLNDVPERFLDYYYNTRENTRRLHSVVK